MRRSLKKNLLLLSLLVLPIFLCNCFSSTSLTKFLDQLELPTTVSENIELNTSYEYKSQTIVSVSWYSSNEDAISVTGVVTRQTYDQEVILIATATLGDDTLKKTYRITVLKDDSEDILTRAAKTIMMPSYADSSINLITSKVFENQTITITWSSDHPSIISDTGIVVLPDVQTTVILSATLMLNSKTITKMFSITVPMSPESMPGERYAKASLYTSEILNATYPDAQTAFQGALYRKVLSSRDNWLGIEVVVTLPDFIPDEGRTGENPFSDKAGDLRYLDNPSVYLGGNCRKECDVGLTWSVGASDATCSSVDYSSSIAFRPFWRYITVAGSNIYANASWKQTEYYYYPGDTIRMSVYSASDDKLQLRIELLKETTIEKYVAKRASYNLADGYSKVFTSPDFESSGAGKYKMVFKRVCALDQVNNEGQPTQPTNASSVKTIFKEVYLYRNIDGVVYKVPMTERYCTGICAPSGSNSLGDFTNAFLITNEGITNTALGGECVTIAPNNRK